MILLLIGRALAQSFWLYLRKIPVYVLFGVCYFMIYPMHAARSQYGTSEMIIYALDSILVVVVGYWTFRFIKKSHMEQSNMDLAKMLLKAYVSLWILSFLSLMAAFVPLIGIVALIAVLFFQFNYVFILDENQDVIQSFQSSLELVKPYFIQLVLVLLALGTILYFLGGAKVAANTTDPRPELRYVIAFFGPFSVIFTICFYQQLKAARPQPEIEARENE
jgi:hypothetical protein